MAKTINVALIPQAPTAGELDLQSVEPAFLGECIEQLDAAYSDHAVAHALDAAAWNTVVRYENPLGAPESVDSGAIDPDVPCSRLSVDGTVAYTLADGSYNGQLKTVTVYNVANTPDGTLTPATGHGWLTADFDADGETATFRWIEGLGWVVVGTHLTTIVSGV